MLVEQEIHPVQLVVLVQTEIILFLERLHQLLEVAAVVAEAAEIRLTVLMVVLVEEVEQQVLLEQEIWVDLHHPKVMTAVLTPLMMAHMVLVVEEGLMEVLLRIQTLVVVILVVLVVRELLHQLQDHL